MPDLFQDKERSNNITQDMSQVSLLSGELARRRSSMASPGTALEQVCVRGRCAQHPVSADPAETDQGSPIFL
jgi:hypothetical protein